MCMFGEKEGGNAGKAKPWEAGYTNRCPLLFLQTRH